VLTQTYKIRSLGSVA